LISFFTLLLAGLLGGLYHYADFLSKRKPEKNNKYYSEFIKKILMSIMAAFTAPLFLNIVGNGEIDNYSELEAFSKGFYYLFGFAIIASFSANQFIDNLSKKLLLKLDENEKNIEKNERVIEEVQSLARKVEIMSGTALSESELATIISKTNKAELYLEKEEFELALDEIEWLLKVHKQIDDKELSKLYVNKAYAIKHSKEYKFEELLFLLDEALKLTPDNSVILYNKACYLALAKQDEKLFNTVEELIKLNKDEFIELLHDEDFNEYKDSLEIISLKEKYAIL